MHQIHNLKELSFLVYGLGASGRSVVKFFKKIKIKNYKVWDDSEKKKLKYPNLENLNKTLKKVDFIVLSPGITLLNNKRLKKYKKKIITDIDLFYLTKNKSKTIVVTGTNGKSTTCKLLAHLLSYKKFKFSIGGNIGTPILDLKHSKSQYVIIEASSFQLSHSKFICPDYAFFLNLTNDHLDWHGSKKDYLNSKLKIFSLQSKDNYALINKKFKKKFIEKNFLSKLLISKIEEYEKIKHKINNRYLNLNINNENMSFVLKFSKLLGISDKSFIKAMKTFKGLPHRFEIFLKKNNITFINDSKATSFKAAQVALSSIKNVYWILGGLPKKSDKIEISDLKKNIIKCYLIGKNITYFKKQIEGKINFTVTKNLENSIISILKDIKSKNNLKKNILLSPAAASFDQFDNFESRGDEFKKICFKYARRFI